MIKEDSLTLEQAAYETSNKLSPKTEYYWRVVEFKNAACWKYATATFATCAQFDLNCNGNVNILDLLEWHRLVAGGRAGGIGWTELD